MNLQIKTGKNHSLTNKWIGPHKVIKDIGTHAYQVEVPQGTQWHNDVQTTLLISNPFHRMNELRHMQEDEEDVYKVKSIIDSRKNKGVVKYKVRQATYTELEDTWETFDKL